jgi:hypothetical protein
MRVLKSLNDFLLNATDAVSFQVDVGTIEEMTPHDAVHFNEILKNVRAGNNFEAEQVDGGWRFTKIVARERTTYEGDKPDARVGVADPDNPFRPRYRKLTDPELAHHDAIKTQASILLDLFRGVAYTQTLNGISYTDAQKGEVLANLKLAQRHLEDAVYRAVKALTA